MVGSASPTSRRDGGRGKGETAEEQWTRTSQGPERTHKKQVKQREEEEETKPVSQAGKGERGEAGLSQRGMETTLWGERRGQKSRRNSPEQRAPSQRWRWRSRSLGSAGVAGVWKGTPEGVKEGTGPPQAEHSRWAGPREARGGPAGSGTSASGSSSRLCKQLAMRSLAAAPATGPARHLRGTCSWRKCTRSPPWGGGGRP